MAVSKITISLPPELLGEIDRLADERGESRSTVVREAAAHYVTAQLGADAAVKRAEGTQRLLDEFARLSATRGRTSKTSLELLRELRGESDAPGEAGG